MRDFEIDGKEVVVPWCAGAAPAAFDAACPHEGISLAFGEFDGQTIVCGAHGWSFDARNGEGVYPGNCRLRRYPLRIVGADVLIDLRDDSLVRS